MHNFLLQFRKNRGFTQEDFANEIGITLTYYSKIELGLRNPSYNFLNKFKHVFPESSVDEIFFNDI